MTKRYREQVEIVTGPAPGTSGDGRSDPGVGGRDLPGVGGRDLPGVGERNRMPDEPVAPVAFSWRGSRYRVVTVLGHWREDAAYWAGGGIQIPQRDLWRVEARNGTPGTGVYELVCEGNVWRLDRIWD